MTDAEDLYQETWCRVIDKLPTYDETRPFEPWLFTICVNTYRNAYNKTKRRQVATFATSEEQDRALDSAADERPLFNAEHDLIRQVINGLDEKYRVVVILHYFDDYPVSTLAAVLHIPQGTVKSRLYKARELIRRRLENEES